MGLAGPALKVTIVPACHGPSTMMNDDLGPAGCGVFVLVVGSSLLLPIYPVIGITGMFLGTILANHLYVRADS
jgi:hypothetical protein